MRYTTAGNVTNVLALKIKDILEEETNIPFFFDVLVYANINNNELFQHIDREGAVVYTKEKTNLANNST